MASSLCFVSATRARVLPRSFPVVFNSGIRVRARVVRCGGSEESAVLSSDSLEVNGSGIGGGNGRIRLEFDEKKKEKKKKEEKVVDRAGRRSCLEELETFWDDGYGMRSVKDYLDLAAEMIQHSDGGPPRWFCPIECGQPINNAPLLLFLPGMDGVGLGLILHHKALGRIFEVRCLHIPVFDRTPFEGLVKYVENTVRLEYALSPHKPIYLVGDSFGGCLALAVAARNPAIDLVLVLANPATSFGKSQLQPLLPILESLPEEFHFSLPYLLSFIMGDPVRMAMATIDNRLPPAQTLEQLSSNLVALLPRLSVVADIIPKETLLWKLKLLKSAAAYANSRLHAVRADVLVLASGKDNTLPSGDEARHLSTSLQNCKIRYFKENGHTLLLEVGLNLVAVLKGTSMYRQSRRHDFVLDYLPPSMTEFKEAFAQGNGYRLATGPVMLSTLEDGKIVRGLAGVPSDGPVILVGYHMLLGLELRPLIEGLLSEKKIVVRGMVHPALFALSFEGLFGDESIIDGFRQWGALPVSASNLYRLLQSNSFVLLYPGGAREALHRKGEEYKLFWPKQPEFVRMASKFEATIVPFGVVGEDDMAQLVLDRDDLMSLPIVGDYIKEQNKDSIKLRSDTDGEVADEQHAIPLLLPKIPGRFYYLFGKPIQTKGKKEMLRDKENAKLLYLQVKSEVENLLSYLKKKRKKDPYRGIAERILYRVLSAPSDGVPAFEP